jgi:hypothetical protein
MEGSKLQQDYSLEFSEHENSDNEPTTNGIMTEINNVEYTVALQLAFRSRHDSAELWG